MSGFGLATRWGLLLGTPLLIWLALPGRFSFWPLLLVGLVPLFSLVGSAAHRFDGTMDCGKRGHHDDLDFWILAFYLRQSFHATHPGHHRIEQDQVECFPGQGLQRRFTIFCRERRKIVISKNLNQIFPQIRIIIDDQYFNHYESLFEES